MNESIIDKVKREVSVLDVIKEFGGQPDRHNKMLCPFHHEKTPSFSIDVEKNFWKCFGCGKSGDAINYVAELEGLDMVTAAKRIADRFNISYDEEKKREFTMKEYLEKCKKNVSKTGYFLERGLTPSTIEKFCLGYDESRYAVTIPYSSKLDYYQTRSVIDKKFFKPKTEDAGPEPIYNASRIRSLNRKCLYVVESPICAMSVEQCGGNAVATCGTSGWRKVAEAIVNAKYRGGVILCFDNDEPGRTASMDMLKHLMAHDIKCIEYNIASEKKDPNELLMEDANELESNIKKARFAYYDASATVEDSASAKDLIKKVIPPQDWVIDKLLPTGLSFLAAKSKSRKSWMVLQMCLAVASGGTFLGHKAKKCGALYYALEDTEARMKDRITKMLKDKECPDDFRVTFRAKTMQTGLFDKLEEELERRPNIKLIVIDTLQKVRDNLDKENTLYGSEYKEMGKVKDFADKHKVCILFVHHLRKQADDDDVFNTISGSTALMGAADTIFIISKKKRSDELAKFAITGRDIEESELLLQFDETKYIWEVAGTPEEVAMRREKIEYEKDPFVRTIRTLINENPLHAWKGTATDLCVELTRITGKQEMLSPTSAGKTLAKYDARLKLEGIIHTQIRGTSRMHVYTKIPPKPRTFLDASDGNMYGKNSSY